MSQNPKDIAAKAKVQLQLLPPAAKLQIAQALEHGARKYGAWNWRTQPISISNYIGAIDRHLTAIQGREDIDPESGLSHWAHIAAGCCIVLDALQQHVLEDDRPPCPETR